MPNARKRPHIERIVDWKDQGLTYQDMADKWFEESGIRVAPNTFRMALARAGRTVAPRRKFEDLIPWQPIWAGHNMDYNLQRLRWLGRRRNGEQLPEDVEGRLNKWLRELAELRDEEGNACSLAYDYESEHGFYFLPREPGDLDMGDGLWIRPPAESTTPDQPEAAVCG